MFVEELDEVPPGSTVIFSAHGVSQAVRRDAEARGLKVFDATCPLVTKVHVEVAKMRKAGREIVMIGHGGHPEVEGTMGQVERRHAPRRDGRRRRRRWWCAIRRSSPTSPRRRCRSTTPRRSSTALKRRFPAIVGPKKDDICYATQNRQDAVKFWRRAATW